MQKCENHRSSQMDAEFPHTEFVYTRSGARGKYHPPKEWLYWVSDAGPDGGFRHNFHGLVPTMLQYSKWSHLISRQGLLIRNLAFVLLRSMVLISTPVNDPIEHLSWILNGPNIDSFNSKNVRTVGKLPSYVLSGMVTSHCMLSLTEFPSQSPVLLHESLQSKATASNFGRSLNHSCWSRSRYLFCRWVEWNLGIETTHGTEKSDFNI